MTLEDKLHDTFLAAVAGLEQPDRWQEVVTRGRRRRRNRRIAALGSAATALVAAVGIVVAVAGGPTTRQVKVAPAHDSRTAPLTTRPDRTPPAPATATPQQPAVTRAATPPPSTAAPSTATGVRSASTPPPTVTAPAQSHAPPTAAPTPYAFQYVPLYPFTNQSQANAWLAVYRTNGAQPWHEDPEATALAFAAFLNYTDINKVTRSDITATQAHVSVGYGLTPSQSHTAAVIHLVRFGPGLDAPWEVVGTDDQPGFTITSPAYGSSVRSPILAGGQITGVDESITVQVFTLSSSIPVGRTCCQPAGGTTSPWTVSVPFAAPRGGVFIVSAATGGHVAAVERFAVTSAHD